MRASSKMDFCSTIRYWVVLKKAQFSLVKRRNFTEALEDEEVDVDVLELVLVLVDELVDVEVEVEVLVDVLVLDDVLVLELVLVDVLVLVLVLVEVRAWAQILTASKARLGPVPEAETAMRTGAPT
jgi:hypothetical protein